MKGLKTGTGLLVAKFQTTEVTEPRKRSLDNIAKYAETATGAGVHGCESGVDSTSPSRRDVFGASIGAVAHEHAGSITGATSWALNGWDAVEQLDGRNAVINVGRRSPDDQGDARGIGD